MIETKEIKSRNSTIPVRKLDFTFKDADIPHFWFDDDILATHMANSLNMIFPKGERFFVRSVRHFEKMITDPKLREDIKGFYGQEGAHSREHERFFEILQSHGLDTTKFLDIYQKIAFDIVESNAPKNLNLAVTAALEHFTAMFATGALSEDDLEGAHPVMRELLKWHAAEEIEHKAVAFDVLQTVDDRYSLRIAGLVAAMILLSSFWTVGTLMLVSQEKKGFRRAMRSFVRGVWERKVMNGQMLDAFRDYWRRDFHPNQIDNLHLAREYLKSVGLEAA